MSLFNDQSGELDYPLVLSVMFLVTFALLLPGIVPYIAAGEISGSYTYHTSQQALEGEFDAQALIQNRFWLANGIDNRYGIEVYPENVHPYYNGFEWWNNAAGDDKIWAFVENDDGSPRWTFRNEYSRYKFFTLSDEDIIDNEEIVRNLRGSENNFASWVKLPDLGHSPFTIIFKPTDNAVTTENEFISIINSFSEYKVYVAQNIQDLAQSQARSASMNAWSLLGGILTMDIPNVGNSTIEAMIGIPIWIVLAYITFRLIIMMIGALPFT